MQKEIDKNTNRAPLDFLMNLRSRAHWKSEVDELTLSQAHGKSYLENQALQRWSQKVYDLHLNYFAPPNLGRTLELGSGASIFKKFMPELITSDVLPLEKIDLIIDAQQIALELASLDNITMVNVLHHVQKPLKFFSEAARVLRRGGRVVITDPYVSLLSLPIYKFAHHEPCRLSGPVLDLGDNKKALLDSNQAMLTRLLRNHLPEILENPPRFRLVDIRHHSGLSYFLSGGVNYRPFLPYSVWKLVSSVDDALCSFAGRLFAGFATVVFERIN